MSSFRKATKAQAKLRAALFGPSGAGKTFSALRIATGLGGSIAFIDSERGSASKYADRFEFDVCDLANKTIDGYCKVIKEAGSAGYNVLVIDSLSHAWQELLEEVDQIAKSRYKGNTWSAWSDGTPKQRRLIDAILDFPGHVLATMRSKTEWTTSEGRNGKSQPVRVGLAPEQGKGIEYEFDLLLEINPDHMASVMKDRTGKFQDQIISKPGEEFGQQLAAWLSEGVPMAPQLAPPSEATATSTNGHAVSGPSWGRFASEESSKFNSQLDALYELHAVRDVDRGYGKTSPQLLAMAIANLAVERGAPAPRAKTPEWASSLTARVYMQKQEKIELEVEQILAAEYNRIVASFDPADPANESQEPPTVDVPADADDSTLAGVRG